MTLDPRASAVSVATCISAGYPSAVQPITRHRPPLDRERRLPLYVQVLTRPPIHDCWAVDISGSGIGLVARQGEGRLPGEGERVHLELPLPGVGVTIQATGRIMWRYDRLGVGGGGSSVALGVAFERLAGQDKVELIRYLHDYLFHVAVAFAAEGEKDRLSQALEGQTEVHFANSPHELKALLSRGDVSAVVLCGTADEALAVVDELGPRGDPSQPIDSGADRDLVPRLILAAPVAPERLLPLFNSGSVFRALPPQCDSQELKAAVLEACRDYGVRTEQHRVSLALERALLRERADTRRHDTEDAEVTNQWVFKSPAMRELLDLIMVAAPHKVAVLLQGETGTGKEVLAQTVHTLSSRANEAFVVQDCGALTETLLESELFGHVKGAFTGAVNDHPGLFVIADGGTIFLDEIENTTANLQAKLLRVIETGEVRPVGGTRSRHVDVRVIAAGNRDLATLVDTGEFRADLYYRLNNFPIRVPPLRERREDILPLTARFIRTANANLRRTVLGVTGTAERALMAYRWPGNVRELRNIIERAVLLAAPGHPIDMHHLLDNVHEASMEPALGKGTLNLKEQMALFERRIIQDALRRNDGVLARAAVELGLHAVTLGRKAKRHGLLDS